MRWLLAAWFAVLPIAATAGLLDLLPLGRIERAMLYPFSGNDLPLDAANAAGLQAQVLDLDGADVVVWFAAPERHRGPVVLYLHGNAGDLAAAVAIASLSAMQPPERPAGVILEAPFTSVPAMARAMTDVPDNLISRISDRWDSLGRAGALTVPLLVVHGTSDEVTPFEMGRTIFGAAPVRDKDFLAVRGACHSCTWQPQITRRLWRFIRDYAGALAR